MLTKLYIENFKSFMEKAEIDLKATGYEILSNTNKTENDILKGALFVGGNATGKSTILHAIRFLLQFLVWQNNILLGEYVCFFKESNQQAKVEYEFLINNIVIKYELQFNEKEIFRERLLEDNKVVLDRMRTNAEYIDGNEKKVQLNNLQVNQSAIRKIYFDTKFIDSQNLKLWYEFLENSVYIDQEQKMIYKVANSFSRGIYQDYFENNGTEEINKFLDEIGYNQYVKYTNEYTNGKVSFKTPDNGKEAFLIRRNMEFGMPLGAESAGNKVLINNLPAIIEAMQKNSMVIIDEFSSGWHNTLEEKTIKYFMKNSKKSQLFIVSHSTNLLTNTLLRPDQIYTVDFINGKGSKINRVSDEKPREAQNLEKMYLSGVFNGIPNTK